MSKIAIVTDSKCDLPNNVVKEKNIIVIPLNVHFGMNFYYDYSYFFSKTYYVFYILISPGYPNFSDLMNFILYQNKYYSMSKIIKNTHNGL